ncbi:hypothetical protein [Burkholderia sp. TSV86]|uniref:hypothetical protein n=1 Tax=Burkholderia sp. TSV86 TaxID=1385594 RepID=UPI0007555380|nr:hypothetical protein [Burkholderia sp. TSV86]KVE37322.1 hypothetical protein WS68_02920 [Burkholderia sp. TSV86]
MNIDRTVQTQILKALMEYFPFEIPPHELAKLEQKLGAQAVLANSAYLSQHGLVKTSVRAKHLTELQLLAKGVDLLLGDGGLSAILGTVTFKLHGDTIKDLAEMKIQEPNPESLDKPRFADKP